LDTETTIEYMLQYAVEKFNPESTLMISEGLQKGAIHRG
jgi:hypothetical protein